jgi:hypothetical protein
MIDKIDGVKALRKSMDYISFCQKENCMLCEFADKCRAIIELAVDFSASTNQSSIKIHIP